MCIANSLTFAVDGVCALDVELADTASTDIITNLALRSAAAFVMTSCILGNEHNVGGFLSGQGKHSQSLRKISLVH